MTTIRQQRVQELLYQELSILVANELDDPQLSLLMVTNVVVSRDLRNAKIYVHHDDSEIPRRTILRRLDKATPFIRRQLAQRLTLRVVPELMFYYDDTPERAARVDELIERIRSEREESKVATGSESAASDNEATSSLASDVGVQSSPQDAEE
jgi:ribosome-binding factor A